MDGTVTNESNEKESVAEVSEPVRETAKEAEKPVKLTEDFKEKLGQRVKELTGDAAKPKRGRPAKVEGGQQGEAAKVEAPKQVETPLIAAPADMKAEEKAEFAKLPPAMQQYLSRRSYEMRSDYGRKTEQLSGKEKEVSQILEAVAPVRDEYYREGINPADLVRRSIAWDKALRQNPIEAGRQFLAAYGVDPAELLVENDGQAVRQHQQAFDPSTFEELVEKRIQERFSRLEQEKTTATNFQTVNSFIASKPLFKDPGTAAQLEAAMEPVLKGLKAANPSAPPLELLERAYNYVVNGDPVFAELNAKLKAKADVERTKHEAARAAGASRSISGGPGSGTPTRKVTDMRENLRLRMQGAL